MTNGYVDHRRAAAMETCDRNARTRGWNFSAVPDEPSFSDRLAEIAFRPATWISLGILAVCFGLLKAF